MTDLDDAFDDVLSALVKLRWLVAPEDTRRQMDFFANESCARLLIDMMLGRLDFVPMDKRDVIGNQQLTDWARLHSCAPWEMIRAD